MNKKYILIIIFLSILSLVLAIMLTIKTIEYNKDTGDVPVEEFHDKDLFTDKSYHINDYRNYGGSHFTYDEKYGLLERKIQNVDFYFKIFPAYLTNDIYYELFLFNYGGYYWILQKASEDTYQPVDLFTKEFRFCLIDKSDVLLKERLYDKKYGTAGLTDIPLSIYNPITGKNENQLHTDVFVTPLALKYIQNASRLECLVFFQFIDAVPTHYPQDIFVKEVIAVGDLNLTKVFEYHSEKIISKYNQLSIK